MKMIHFLPIICHMLPLSQKKQTGRWLCDLWHIIDQLLNYLYLEVTGEWGRGESDYRDCEFWRCYVIKMCIWWLKIAQHYAVQILNLVLQSRSEKQTLGPNKSWNYCEWGCVRGGESNKFWSEAFQCKMLGRRAFRGGSDGKLNLARLFKFNTILRSFDNFFVCA